MDQLLERIKKAYHLETDAEVADFLDIKPSTLSMQKNRGHFNLERIIEKCSDLNKNWLFDGNGPIRYRDFATTSSAKKKVPVFSSLQFIADGRVDISESVASGYILLEGELPASVNGNNRGGTLLGYRISDDSMDPLLSSQDIAVVSTEDNSPKDGSLYLVTLDHTISCKRVQEKPKGIYSVSCDNEAYSSFEVPKDQEGFSIIGKVTWIIRTF